MAERVPEPEELWGVFSHDGAVLGAFRLRDSAEQHAKYCTQLSPLKPPATYCRYVLPKKRNSGRRAR